MSEDVRNALHALDANDLEYATLLIDGVLNAARDAHVSDVHFQPTPAGLDIRWRLDGVLQPLGLFPDGQQTNPITRLKVLAELLTYRRDVPQEGRLRDTPGNVEMRLSTLPTVHGERAVVRLLQSSDQPWQLDDLRLPEDVLAPWRESLERTSGMLLITGPAGSGKTTTAYASLRQIVAHSGGGRSVLTLEDPVESIVDGVSQSRVHDASGFTMTRGLRALLRHDPEVLLVGEVRDPETAMVAFQAALTGQLVISTFHADSAASAICRLVDMGIEPYLIRSGLRGILGQRLVRRLCGCRAPSADAAADTGWDLESSSVAVGCADCHHTGYADRVILAELLVPDAVGMSTSLLESSDATTLEAAAVSAGMVTRWERARQAVVDGLTSAAEIRRVLGLRPHEPE